LAIAAAALLIAGQPASASLPPPPDLLASLPSPDSPRAIRFANGAVMLPDIPYEVIPGFRPMRLDLYLPKGSAKRGPLPLVMWIHGGAFEFGDPRTEMSWSDWPGVLADLSARGYAVAAVSYRLSGEAKFPAQTDDLREALRFLGKQAGRWNLDTRRSFVWGGSAGGHLVLMFGLAPAPADALYVIRGIVDWYGPVDFVGRYQPGSNSPEARLLNCANAICSPDALRAASPIALVRPGVPPLLAMHGTADSLVPLSESERITARMKEVGAEAELVPVAGLEHGFWGGDKQQLDTILARTFAFFDRHSRPDR